MQIFVRTPTNRQITLEVEGSDSVESLRRKVHAAAHTVGERRGFPVERQRLFAADELGDVHELEDGHVLSDYNIRIEAQLNLHMIPPPLRVDLNVGGKRSTTWLSTLTAVRGSKLCEMFRGLAQGGTATEHHEGVPEEDRIGLPTDAEGAFVLDRDPRAFDFILNYLRDLSDANAAAGGGGAAAAEAAAPGGLEALDAADEPHLIELREELEGLKLSTLKRRAAAIGVDSAVLFEADDAPDVRGTVIDLIITAVGPKQILLPDTQEDLQRLVIEAQHFGLPELAAACRQKLLRDRQATETDRRQLRSLLDSACRPGLAAAKRAAAVASVERMCGGEFSLRMLREQQQRVADRRMLEDLMGRATFALDLQEKFGMSAAAADALTNDWTGAYVTHRAVKNISEEEAERLGLEAHDVEAAKLLPTFYCTFTAVSNESAGVCSFDRGGVLYYIGTSGHTVPWANPANSGRVTTNQGPGGMTSGSHTQIVNGPGPEHFQNVGTSNTPNSWMAVDLGATRQLVVEHYVLRNAKGREQALCNWELQGAPSADGPWTTLHRHDSDESLIYQRVNCAAWEVDGAAPFRAFRIHQHGVNAQGHNHLCFSGIEFYGSLTEQL